MSRSTKDVGILNIFEAKREAAILRQLPEDWVALVERSRLDPGAPLEKPAIKRLKTLRAEDAPNLGATAATTQGSQCAGHGA